MKTNDSENTVPVKEAIQYTANWRTYMEKSGQEFNIKAFLIPIKSIKSLLEKNPGAQGIRTYLALENVDDPSSAKLMIVPVIDDKDIVYLPDAAKSAAGADDDGESNVYNFTSPCPSICHIDSPLNED